MKNTKLVWSDDPKDQKILNPSKEKPLPIDLTKANFTAIFRLEKSGRGGKTVTVIDGLPRHETFLKQLCKELKSKCGTGGTFVLGKEAGIIEIQGDKRVQLKALLDQKGIRYKGM